MYIDIKHMKSRGFSNSKISKMLGISRPTVIKYVNMTPDEFRLEMEKRTQRVKKAEKYESGFYYDPIRGDIWRKKANTSMKKQQELVLSE